MKRLGSVITFKSDVTKEQAALALASIVDLLDVPNTTMHWDNGNAAPPVQKPFDTQDLVKTFDDKNGGPVWYIP